MSSSNSDESDSTDEKPLVLSDSDDDTSLEQDVAQRRRGSLPEPSESSHKEVVKPDVEEVKPVKHEEQTKQEDKDVEQKKQEMPDGKTEVEGRDVDVKGGDKKESDSKLLEAKRPEPEPIVQMQPTVAPMVSAVPPPATVPQAEPLRDSKRGRKKVLKKKGSTKRSRPTKTELITSLCAEYPRILPPKVELLVQEHYPNVDVIKAALDKLNRAEIAAPATLRGTALSMDGRGGSRVVHHVCPQCSATFSEREEFVKHLTKHTSPDNPFPGVKLRPDATQPASSPRSGGDSRNDSGATVPYSPVMPSRPSVASSNRSSGTPPRATEMGSPGRSSGIMSRIAEMGSPGRSSGTMPRTTEMGSPGRSSGTMPRTTEMGSPGRSSGTMPRTTEMAALGRTSGATSRSTEAAPPSPTSSASVGARKTPPSSMAAAPTAVPSRTSNTDLPGPDSPHKRKTPRRRASGSKGLLGRRDSTVRANIALPSLATYMSDEYYNW